MTILLARDALLARRDIAARELAPLADSLAHDMDRVLREAPAISGQKALLSRDGGRCPTDGAMLEFDPFSPHSHRCPACGRQFTGERHHRWWLMSAQLWRAERAVHAAALFALRGASAHSAFALATLDEYADRYDRYPLADNVLGPSRPFFSTYLESIWLLQLCVAADLLDTAAGPHDVTSRFRELVAAPSAALIRSYDEGNSNRQLWNNAALLAAGRLLHDSSLVDHAIEGSSGLIAQLRDSLLSDGSWYEGENYHLFSHRGLWYGVTMAESLGRELPHTLRDRFQAGFSTPFLTALPDLGFPARRDSQYGASLRQWRTAESCELGLARESDARLTSALGALYAADIPRRDTGRWRSTAEAERNEPASALTRADLGWRSLLFARESLPELRHEATPSALLAGQGIAIFRRDEGRAYAALDYGHHGGSHGHPDRLNILLAADKNRILDDMGTGSYVDESLHWYRSTLAHNAPLVNGRSQPRVSGTLESYEEHGDTGVVSAVALISSAPRVVARRTLLVTEAAVVDELRWLGESAVRVELPIHVVVDIEDAGAFTSMPLDGGSGLEDGFAATHDGSRARVRAGARVRLVDVGTRATLAWCTASVDAEWWSVLAPGAPGRGEQRFVLARLPSASGTIRSVWNWRGSLADARFDGDDSVRLRHVSGADTVHALPPGAALTLDAAETADAASAPATPAHPSRDALTLPLTRELGESDYRRSEPSWHDAGSPRARVALSATPESLIAHVTVAKAPLHFRARDAADPALDNEHPDIHSDSVQLHLWRAGWPEPATWLLVPELGGSTVRAHRAGYDPAPAVALAASWARMAAGYEMQLTLPRASLGNDIFLDVLINEMSSDRERRRGQLVLSGAHGDRVYLRGDRQPVEHFLHLHLPV